MEFNFVKDGIAASLILENEAYSGVVKIANKVCDDTKLVTGILPEVRQNIAGCTVPVLVGTLAHSPLLQRLEQEGKADFSNIRGKWESFSFQLIKNPCQGVEQALIIAGSDKRGTIYGLFHISELMHISPWVHFSDAVPAKQAEIVFTEKENFVSKEPSVKYRGFFINDEWPAFGNWTFEHFGGFTAQMYDLIFETLLRLKGNYLWPAMWSSSFTLDGPGEENARLADEYGIVMCNSHHEPCLRHSEEWDKVRGEHSPYGNEWNYYTNREGLLRYWRDGLKRSGKYENVITIGMRGERDSSMLGPDATLKQNIDLLKEIITEQRKLISECVEPVSGNVPQMLALYKEVEAYFYGDENTEGLKDWDGLDGVTLMLCEDNYGNMRTLPTKELRGHNGGWGMYYHFDYHGGPISYEWVNSSYLPKVWDQMTEAYEFGIRDIWVVNVGDLKFQEYPLSFFMDLAYDYEKWGSSNLNAPKQYLENWVEREFRVLNPKQKEFLADGMKGYTKLGYNRKPEACEPETYHPVHYVEAERVLRRAEQIEQKLELLKQSMPAELLPEFWELVYYPAIASLNVLKLNLYAGWNHIAAKAGAVIANDYASKVKACIARDHALTKTFHTLLNGKWNGMARSEHIGFQHWDDVGCCYPVRMYVEPANKPRLLAYVKGEGVYTTGGDWMGKRLLMRQFMEAGVNTGCFVLLNASADPIAYAIDCDVPGVEFSKTNGVVLEKEEVTVTVNKTLLQEESGFTVRSQGGDFHFVICADYAELPQCPPTTFLEADGLISIEAEHFVSSQPGDGGAFVVLPEYGKTLSGVKALPCDAAFTMNTAPGLEYAIWVHSEGEWTVLLYSAPANSLEGGKNLYFGIQVNEGEKQAIALLPEDYNAGDPGCQAWDTMVLDQIRVTKQKITLHSGVNTLHVFALDPGFTLEKIVLVRDSSKLLPSYLGPQETYFCK